MIYTPTNRATSPEKNLEILIPETSELNATKKFVIAEPNMKIAQTIPNAVKVYSFVLFLLLK